ncbi:MAG: peptidoglycan bridge formation glycyltransferase FemA/FemB family protein [Alphaproteobacteria bacterium]|nr:peptidoglycan bridge formation glycyltransferase FemA/FemB family protein [Alphaproteobacteria bacterium]
MRIEFHKNLDSTQTQALYAFTQANHLPPLALPDWLKIAQTVFNRQPFILLSKNDEGTLNGFCAGYHRQRKLYTLPFGFFAQNDDIAEMLNERLRVYAKEQGLQSACLFSASEHNNLGRPIMRHHLILPLKANDEEELYASIPKKQRNMIKKAQSGEYEISGSWEHIEKFYCIYADHCREKALSQKPIAYFYALREIFGENIMLYSALDKDDVVAGMVFLKSVNAASYLFNASMASAQRAGVNNLLMWEASKSFYHTGHNFIELGLSALESPVYQFKKRLSKNIEECSIFRYEVTFRELSTGERIRQLITGKYNGLLSRLNLRTLMIADPEQKIF